MKWFTVFIFAFYFHFSAIAQMVITLAGQGYPEADSVSYRQILSFPTGAEGAGIVWDYSNLEISVSRVYWKIKTASDEQISLFDSCRFVCSENGYAYGLKLSENRYFEYGYYNSEKGVIMTYDNPVERIRFPFSYGDHYTDEFAGRAIFHEFTKIDVTGRFSVTADAWGILVLPDRVLDNVLRVKTVRTGLQTMNCGSVFTTVTRYNWYAPGYRYPVLITSKMEQVSGAEDTVVTKLALLSGESPAGSASFGRSEHTDDEKSTEPPTVFVYPNPFSDKTNYHFTLGKSGNVSMEIFDLTGKIIRKVLSWQTQEKGFHRGEINAEELSLPPGVYFAGFHFNDRIRLVKLVKL